MIIPENKLPQFFMFSVDSSSFRSIEFKRRSKNGGIPRSFGGIAAHHAWWFMPCVDADGNQLCRVPGFFSHNP